MNQYITGIIIKELMYADEYKDSKGSILIRIPDYDLDKNIFVIDDNGRTRLNPKYIVGYVPVYENHHLESIITPNMINTMNSLYSYKFQERENNNQIYQERVEYRSRR